MKTIRQKKPRWVASFRNPTHGCSKCWVGTASTQPTVLEITDTKKGGIKDSKGAMVFKAFYMQDGEEHVMNEISRFKKINGRWFYLDDVIKSIGKVSLQTNQGKHAPCSCGSSKKFKRCCGAESNLLFT